MNNDIEKQITNLYDIVGLKIEHGNFKDAIDLIFELIRYANKYFDSEKPWLTRNEDIQKCSETVFNCVQVIANAAKLLVPFLPFSSKKNS